MLFYVLGFFDILTSFVLAAFTLWGWFDTTAILYHATYITVKGAVFSYGDWASRIDLLVGIYMFLVAFSLFSQEKLSLIAAAWLLEKGILSMTGILKHLN